jgi:hypothetical protein
MMCKKLFSPIFAVSLLVICVQVQAQVIFSDDFDHAMMDDWSRINYQGWYEQNVLGWPSPGGPWVIGNWDSYQSLPDDTGVSPTVLAYNFIDTFNIGMGEPNQPQPWTPGYEGPILNGVLRITSTAAGWSDQWNTGPFLYKIIEGDFVAQVEVVSADYWWHAMGGLMARVPNPDGVGENENWVYLNYFPLYNVGNNIRNTINGASTEMQSPWRGFPADPYLRLQRSGNTFFFYTSPDGETWTSLPGLEDGVVRDDMPAELQVGIFQANFTGDWQVTMDFDNFTLETGAEAEPSIAGLIVENPDQLMGFEPQMLDRLESLGYAVEIIKGDDVKDDVFTVADAEALDVIVVSEAISSSDVNRLAGANVPIMHGEGYGWHKMNYAEDGTQGWQDATGLADVVNDTHPIVVAAGLSLGTMDFLTHESATTTTAEVSVLAPGAVSLVSMLVEGTEYALVFAIDTGAELAKGAGPATNRIVGFSLPGDQEGVLSDAGWALFDAAIDWLDQ